MEAKNYKVIVVGGGMAGICAAIAAAREGAETALIHNRPVLGGNASSEIRMHICGADNHMKRKNARETGILEEILLENKRRNPEMVYPIFDAVLWEKVHFQEKLTLYLNTHMTDVQVDGSRVKAIESYQLTTEKKFILSGDYFIDATGDGTLGALAGAQFQLGREDQAAHGESLAPAEADCCTMGNSLMFKARDMGRPVTFLCPEWANHYTEEQLRFRDHQEVTSGYWWIELGGGSLHTISDAEILRDELLKAVYGVWDHIKNGGEHRAENLELEWVGFLPGKRESRRLTGDYVLSQEDISAGRVFEDAVAYGGWPMDVHTVEGFLKEEDNPTVWNQVNDIYTIPYRCLYSKNIENLFLGGRAISCTHIAFSSTRVMGTCSVAGQAAGTAAAMAAEKNVTPRELAKNMKQLQQRLLKNDCYIPGAKNEDALDIARLAKVSATAYLAGYEPEKVINGYARAIGEEENCFKAEAEKEPVLTLSWNEAHRIGEVVLLFDSNLSREIMPSLSDTVMARQVQGPPPELVKSYQLSIYRKEECICRKQLCTNGQRRQSIFFGTEIGDRLEIKICETYGSKEAAVFEVRVYE